MYEGENMTTNKQRVFHTTRILRAATMIENRHQEVLVDYEARGGIYFLIEVDYNVNRLRFTAAIARNDENFDSGILRSIAESRAFVTQQNVYSTDFESGIPLLDQVCSAVLGAEAGKDEFLRTLKKTIKRIVKINESTNQMIDEYEQE